MASLRHSSSKLLKIAERFSCKCRSFSVYKNKTQFSKLYTTCGVLVGVSAFYYINKLRNSHTVHAYKPRKGVLQIPSGLRFMITYTKTKMTLLREPKEEDLSRAVKLTSRERRFIKFASVEYDSQLYMTPQDFLESFVDQDPRPRVRRKNLTQKELEMIRDSTPTLAKGTSRMFRDLRDKGIISYTEYLFLLSILTKPQTGFRIAFNMFDTDGNERVDKNEFLVLLLIFAGKLTSARGLLDPFSRRVCMNLVAGLANKSLNVQVPIGPLEVEPRDVVTEASESLCMNLVAGLANKSLNVQVPIGPLEVEPRDVVTEASESLMEKIFSHAWKDKRGQTRDEEGSHEEGQPIDEYVDDEEGLQRRHAVDTTLIVHFFGKRGNSELRYEGFRKFMENLQSEVLELEFHEFSKGSSTISEIDFAKILLRYTYLDMDAYDMFLDRLLDRVKEDNGISFEEFKVFCQFLNNLEDFTIAMRMYTLADHPISKDEFHRAVKICTGTSLSEHVVHTVFALFDEDGDGQLSYREFIAIMKDRIHRGFKITPKNEGLESFKQCLRSEIKSPG